jgi:hypothetical protein
MIIIMIMVMIMMTTTTTTTKIIQWCKSPLPGQGCLTVRFLDHAEKLPG